jgi:transcriptional regulator with XRE-family HTH domain
MKLREERHAKALGEAIRLARLAAGMKQAPLADEIGKPQSWLSRIERGDVYCRVTDLVVLARVLHVAPGQLIERIEGI